MRLRNFEVGTGDHVIRGLFTYNEECFIHRLRIGVPMLNEDQFHAFQDLFDFETLADYQSQEVIREIDGVYEDTCGMLEAGDLDSAVLSARNLIELSVDAYLHKRRNTDPNVKWRARYFELFDDGSARHREITENYWKLEFPGDVGPGADESVRRGYVERCIAFSRTTTSWIQS